MALFENTATAFAAKNDKELKKAYRLFKLIGYNWLISVGPFFLNLALKIHLPIKGLIKNTIFKQFCGGESINDSLKTVAELAKFNVHTILDLSIEGKENEQDFDNTAKEIIANVRTASTHKSIPFAVFKVTGIARFALLEKVNAQKKLTAGEAQEYENVKKRIDDICGLSHELKVPVFIDAEETWIQDAIDNLALDMMRKYNKEAPIVYNTPQLYRHDRLDYIKQLYETAVAENFYAAVKIVRGAYMEKERARAKALSYPDPIQKDKAHTDKDFNAAIVFCLEHIGRIAICCGSHNEESSALMADLIQQKGLKKDDSRLYFAQLFGMSDHISFNLAKDGYNVAKYLPYGPVKEVVPYLIRRAQENTSVSGQQSRELRLILQEIKRRKSLK